MVPPDSCAPNANRTRRLLGAVALGGTAPGTVARSVWGPGRHPSENTRTLRSAQRVPGNLLRAHSHPRPRDLSRAKRQRHDRGSLSCRRNREPSSRRVADTRGRRRYAIEGERAEAAPFSDYRASSLRAVRSPHRSGHRPYRRAVVSRVRAPERTADPVAARP